VSRERARNDPFHPGASAWLVRLALGATAIVGIFFIAQASFIAEGHRTFSLFDDAMISMRYAANLAAGDGLVWNPGQPPVEGYTNLLWTLWMAVLHLVPVPVRLTSLLVSLSGVALLVATAAVSARLATRLSGDRGSLAAPIAAALVGLCYPLVFWTLRGMEVGLLALLIALSVEMAFRIRDGDPRATTWLALCLALLTLTRPDGIFPALTIAAGSAAAAPRQPWRLLVILCAVPLTVMGLHTAWRLSYYGDPLPNTYYLKMTGVTLAERLSRGATVGAAATGQFLLLTLAFALAALHRERGPVQALTVAIPLLLAGYSVYVGGDVWEWLRHTNRYLTPAFAVVIPAAVAALASRDQPTRRLVAAIAAAAVVIELWLAGRSSYAGGMALHIVAASLAGLVGVLAWQGVAPRLAVLLAAVMTFGSTSMPGYLDWRRNGIAHAADDAVVSRVGMLVRATTSPEARIAVVWAGALPYFAQRETIDLLGKNDRRIARMRPVTPFVPGHNKFDYLYSIGELRPDLVLQLSKTTPETSEWIVSQGYDRLRDEVFVLRNNPFVAADRLAAELPVRIP